MLQSIESQRVIHTLTTEQQQLGFLLTATTLSAGETPRRSAVSESFSDSGVNCRSHSDLTDTLNIIKVKHLKF